NFDFARKSLRPRASLQFRSHNGKITSCSENRRSWQGSTAQGKEAPRRSTRFRSPSHRRRRRETITLVGIGSIGGIVEQKGGAFQSQRRGGPAELERLCLCRERFTSSAHSLTAMLST